MRFALQNPAVQILLVGDLLTAVILTLVGFASHNELGSAGLRMLTTFLPLLAAWLLVAPFAGLYQPENVASARRLPRVLWAALLAGPLAATLRGLWLARPIAPVFVVVFSGSAALAFLAWRGLFIFINRKLVQHG